MMNGPTKNIRSLAIKLILLSLWVLLVLYPNPGNLAASIYRLKNPPVQREIVTAKAEQLVDYSPCEVKAFVYSALPYRFDWEIYNMPWYFPTLEEALQKKHGDCKARYLLFASLLEELEIPYEKNLSLTHIWVGYEGKPENALENASESIIVVDASGRFKISMPQPDLARSWRNFYHGFWEAMPAHKKYLLLTGIPAVFGPFYLQPHPFRGADALKPQAAKLLVAGKKDAAGRKRRISC